MTSAGRVSLASCGCADARAPRRQGPGGTLPQPDVDAALGEDGDDPLRAHAAELLAACHTDGRAAFRV